MEQRLGQNGIDDFRNHPFFEGIDWDNLGDSKLLLINILIDNIPCLASYGILKVNNDHCSEFSNLSNWKEEA